MTVRERIDAELAKLSSMDREMVWLLYGYDRPEGFTGCLPASTHEVAEFLGLKYKGKAFSTRRVQQRMKSLLVRWERERMQKRVAQ